MVASPTPPYGRESNVSSVFSATQRNSFDKLRRNSGVERQGAHYDNRSSPSSGNGGGTYRGFSGGMGNTTSNQRSSSNPAVESNHFFPSNASSPRVGKYSRGASIVTNVNQHINHPSTVRNSSEGSRPNSNSDQLAHQKDQWNVDRDIPTGTVRNNPFLPQPKPQAPQPAQLMHQKKQWDTSNIPRGSVAARTQVMELESPRNSSNTFRPGGKNSSWQPQPIPVVNLDSSMMTSPVRNRRRSFSPAQHQAKQHSSNTTAPPTQGSISKRQSHNINNSNSSHNTTSNNVTSHSSSMRGRMIETGAVTLNVEPPTATTSPRWEPSREIPKGTVKGRKKTLFGGEEQRREQSGAKKEQTVATKASYGGYSTGGEKTNYRSIRPTSGSQLKTTRPDPEDDDDEEDPWIIPDRKGSNRKAYRGGGGGDWGEAAVSSAKSSESDDWDAPVKEWLQSESQSSEEDLFKEARPGRSKKPNTGPKEYEHPPESAYIGNRSRASSLARQDEFAVPRELQVDSKYADMHNSRERVSQQSALIAGDRDTEILQAAQNKRNATTPTRRDKARPVQDLSPTKDVSAYLQPPREGDAFATHGSTLSKSIPSRTIETMFQPFKDVFNQVDANQYSNNDSFRNTFAGVSDRFPQTEFSNSKPIRIENEHDSFGFPTPTSSNKNKGIKHEDEEFFDAVGPTRYPGPLLSASPSQRVAVTEDNSGSTKPDVSMSRSASVEMNNDGVEQVSEEEEPKQKKKGGFFKGLFGGGRKSKGKESSKSKRSGKEKNRSSFGSAREEVSPIDSKSVKSHHSSGQSRAAVEVVAVMEHSSLGHQKEQRSAQVFRGRCEDDTTISEMTNPTVFKDASNPSAPTTKAPTLHILSTIDSRDLGDDTVTPRSSLRKTNGAREDPRALDTQKVDERHFVDPELDHLDMETNSSDEDELMDSIASPIVLTSVPAPPPRPRSCAKSDVAVSTSNKSSTTFTRRLRKTSPAFILSEEKKDDDDKEHSARRAKNLMPVGRRLSGSSLSRQTVSNDESDSSGGKTRPRRRLSDRALASTMNVSVESPATLPQNLRSLSQSSRKFKSSTEETSPIPTRGIRSMSPSARALKPSARETSPALQKVAQTISSSQSNDSTRLNMDAPRIVSRYGKSLYSRSSRQDTPENMRNSGTDVIKPFKPSVKNSLMKNHPSTITMAGTTSQRPGYKNNATGTLAASTKEFPAQVASQSSFARRLAGRKIREIEAMPPVPKRALQQTDSRTLSQKLLPLTSKRSVYGQTYAKKGDDTDYRHKRVILASSTSGSDELTNCSSSTYEKYQRKLNQSLGKSRGIHSSEHSVRSIDYSLPSQHSADSSIGSDVRVLKQILRRPRLGNDYDEVIKVSKRNEGFHTYDEESVTDPMQRVGLRLLSGAIIPIQTEVRRFLATRKALTRMWALIVIQTYARRMLARRQFDEAVYSVITMQRIVRGHNTRTDVNNRHMCAIEIQKVVRGYLATMHVYEEIYKVTLVQSWVRMRIAMDDAAYRMALVIQVQAVARGFLERRRLTRANAAATIIQANWLGFYNRLTYQFELLDIIIVQSLWRRKLGMRAAEKKLERLQTKSATTIQTAWRSYDCRMDYICFLAARVIQTKWRSHTCRSNYVDHIAVRTIQSAWRSHTCRAKYVQYMSARRIQSSWRSHTCRATYVDYIEARKIQTAWRFHKCRAKYVNYISARKIQAIWRFHKCRAKYINYISARKIQAAWRTHTCRTNYVDYIAARTIQSRWRAAVSRAIYSQHIAAREIQSGWRAYVCRVDYKEYVAARKIQSAWRSYDCRMDYICYLAARMIQSNWRAAICREHYLYNIAAKMIQAKWRSFVCQYDYRQYMAARKIQTNWRTSVCRKQYISYTAARTIQSSWRAAATRDIYCQHIAAKRIQTKWRSSVCRNFYVCYTAAKSIQKTWRCFLCRKEFVCYMAARTIQTNWRASICRQDYVFYLAARIIQSNWRASICRQDYIYYLAARVIQAKWRSSVCRKGFIAFVAARTIQSIWRCSVCRKDYIVFVAARTIQSHWRAAICREIYLQNIAAKLIQANWRASVCREDYLAYMSARKIQTSWRAFVCRKDYIEYFAATMIQAQWRAYVLRCGYISYRAATKIQAAWRAYDCKMNYLHFLADILIMQSTFRRFQARKRVNTKKNVAATVIQKTWRGFACFADYEEYKVARKIQSAWRGYVCKALFKEYLSARKIQAAWRGYVYKKCFKEFLAARKIQSVWRGFICYADYHEFLTVRRIQTIWRMYVRRDAYRRYTAARKIQSLWRGFVHFVDYHEYLTVRRIQTKWRGFVCRNAYKRYQAATSIQSAWRGCLAFSDYHEYLTVRSIQSAWRGYVCKKYFKEVLAARKIQAVWRGFICYADYVEFLTVRKIQTIWRMHVHRNAYRRYTAARKIQSLCRGYVQFVDYQEYLNARRIQSAWRGLVCKALFKKYMTARRIQTIWRMYVHRNAYRRYIAARKIQSLCRGYVQFVDYREYLSARRIQTKWRGFVCRKVYKRYQAATLIQCLWRGCRAFADYQEYLTVRRVQRAWRAYSITKKAKKEKAIRDLEAKRQKAAIRIQCAWRGFVSYADYMFAVADIVVVQKILRGFVARRKYIRKRAEARLNAAVAIQRNWRRFVDETEFVVMKYEYHAARRIQTSWRRFWCFSNFIIALDCSIQIQAQFRRYFHQNDFERRRIAAITLQKACRQSLAKQKTDLLNVFHDLMSSSVERRSVESEAATTIQRIFRGMISRTALKVYTSAVKIQAAVRAYQAHFAFKLYLMARRLQKTWRGYNPRRAYVAVLNATVTIQKTWRRFVDETEFVVMKYEYHAARKIQTSWRRFWCFSNFIIAVDCSVQIQSQVRKYLHRNSLGTRRIAVIWIQKACRQSLAKQKMDQLAVVQELISTSFERGSMESDAATTIQSIFRGMISRTALKVYMSAVKIQSAIRAYQARVAVKLYVMARRVQKTWRGFNPRSAYVVFIAARKIQNKWRYVKANRDATVLREELLAAIMIQRSWRGFVCYTDYVFTLSDIVSSQRIVRGYLARKKYIPVLESNILRKKEMLIAAILIQQVSRGLQARQKYWYTLGCTMQIQSWWRGMVAKTIVQKQLNAVVTIQCFARRSLARQHYLQRKFIFMLINTAEKEKTKKVAATRIQLQMRDYMEQRQRDEAARVIQRFFLRVKHEVDQLVRARKRRKKWQKKITKAKKRSSNVEESLLEDAWEAAVSRSNLGEKPYTRRYSNLGSGSFAHMDAKSVASVDQESVTMVETRSTAQPVTVATMDPPGSVASNSLRGSTTGSRSQHRHQQEEMRYRLPPSTVQTTKPSAMVRLNHENDDTSVFSQLTGSTMTFSRPTHHIRVVRKVPLANMEDEFQLEEAFIDAEIVHAKERRQMASSGRGGYPPQQSSRAPRPSRKSTGDIVNARRGSHDGIAHTNSRSGDSVASTNSRLGRQYVLSP